MRVDVSETIDVARDRVFDLMGDARNEPTWNPKVTRCDLDTTEPVGQGSSFTAVYRGLTYTDTITEHDRPSRLTFTVTGRLLTIVARMRFEEAGGSTQLRAEFDVQPHGVMKALLPVMGPVVRRDFRRALAGFRRFCESRNPGAA